MAKSITRSAFEQKLGGEFEPTTEEPGRRVNTRWVTYKEFSKKTPERLDCFCAELRDGGRVFSGKNWTELAEKMEMQNG